MTARGRPRGPLSAAERDALCVLWAEHPLPAGEVRRRLTVCGRSWAYTTTKTVLDRLERKGYLRRVKDSTPHLYHPVVSAEMLARNLVERLRRELFDDAGLPLMRALLDGASLSAEDMAELRMLLAEAESTVRTDG